MRRGTVLITGASSGIGEAFARRFAEEGFDLILTARREERLLALKTELDPDTTSVVPGDLSTSEGIDAFCESLAALDLEVDILVNNAGVLFEETLEAMSQAQLDAMMSINMTAPARLIHKLLPAMKQRGSGRILNVASMAAFHPVAGMDLYAATKAFLLSLSESLAENLRGTGVSVTALCPGITRTESVNEKMMSALPDIVIMSPAAVADAGFQALMQREAISVPGDANRLAVMVAQHQPRWLMRSLSGLAARLTR
ncbi:MAG: SDR family NAD(P)-dependent oxidoreductase [Gammaproteobacteria bacterium]